MALGTSSSLPAYPLHERVRYFHGLLAMRVAALRREPDFSDIEADVAHYDALVRRHVGKPLASCRAFEIGYGQRPMRLAWLLALGADATGVDRDQPVFAGRVGEFLRAYRQNGAVRFLKTLARFALFDRHDWRALGGAIRARTGRLATLDPRRLRVADAGSEAAWEDAGPGFDFVYSEDVFEHVPPDDLERVVSRIAAHLAPNGIAFVRPLVFTGITGGHLLEWYPHTLAGPRRRRSEPWEHLRRDRFPADTYLNRLSRRDYRELFGRHLEVLDEQVVVPDLGREFLTPEIRAELAAYGEEELFSNKVGFVLRRR
jgi:Methyltransferase domain